MFFSGCATSAQGVPARAISMHTFSFIRYIIITGLARFGPLTQHALSCRRRCGPLPARPTDPRSHFCDVRRTAHEPRDPPSWLLECCHRAQSGIFQDSSFPLHHRARHQGRRTKLSSMQ